MTPGDEAGALREEEETRVDSADSASDAHDDPAPAEPDPGATTIDDDASDGADEASAEASVETDASEADAPAVKTRAEKKAEKAAAKAEKARLKAERAAAAAKAPAAEEAPAEEAPAAEAPAAEAESAEDRAAETKPETVASEAVAEDEGTSSSSGDEAPGDEAEEDTEVGEEPSPAFGWTPSEDSGEGEASRPAGVWMTSVAVLVVLLIAGLVTAGLFWSKASSASADASGKQAAISTAKTAVTDLFTIDYKNPNAFADRLKPLAAGQFLGVVQNSAGGVAKLLQQGKVQTTGKAQLAGVESFKGDTAQVAVLGYEIIKNSQNPQGSERPYRMILSMVKSGSKWVVSNLEFVQ